MCICMNGCSCTYVFLTLSTYFLTLINKHDSFFFFFWGGGWKGGTASFSKEYWKVFHISLCCVCWIAGLKVKVLQLGNYMGSLLSRLVGLHKMCLHILLFKCPPLFICIYPLYVGESHYCRAQNHREVESKDAWDHGKWCVILILYTCT